MPRNVCALCDLVHQQTPPHRSGSSHIFATAAALSHFVTDASSVVFAIFPGIDNTFSAPCITFCKYFNSDVLVSIFSIK